jgi:quercetin dioxygenase-like cupin family protein
VTGEWAGANHEEESKMSSRPHPESERPMHGPLQSFDIGAEVARLRSEEAFRQSRRNSITLRKGEGMSVVLLVMGTGDRLEEHAAPGPISFTVREGRVRFSTPDEEVEAGPETLLACDAGVRHAVEALEDAVCVVTIARGDGR